MKKTVFVRALCLLFVFSFFVSDLTFEAFAEDLPDTSGAAYVYMKNTDRNTLIYEKNNGAQIPPASSAKIVTGLLALELLSGRLDERVEIKKYMVEGSKGASMYLDVGESLTVRELLYAAVCAGYNDASYALASVASGGASEFVLAMNEKARELGAKNTYFTNPTGYDDAMMRTTLDDVVLIARAAMQNEAYLEISSTVSKKIFIEGRGEFILHNRNALIGEGFAQGYVNNSVRGLIAGVTDAGYCVITSPVIDGDEYICIVMQGQELDGKIMAYSIANALIDYARYGFESVTLMPGGELICTIPVDFALDASQENGESVANVRTAYAAQAFLPLSSADKQVRTRHYLYYERLSAPTKKGTVVGGIDFFLDGELLCSVPLVINAEIEVNALPAALDSVKGLLTSRVVWLSLGFGVFLGALYLFLLREKIERRGRRRAMHIDLERKKKTK